MVNVKQGDKVAIATQLEILSYTPDQRRGVELFLLDQYRVHYHLDWHPVETWLQDVVPFSVVGYRLQQIVGLLLFTPPHRHITWLRMAALHNDAQSSDFAELMHVVTGAAHHYGITEMMALESDTWLSGLLLANRFRLVDKIIHMKRPANLPLIEHLKDPLLGIYSVAINSLEDIIELDHAAFGPYWQMRAADLAAMAGVASLFICATIGNQIAGYLLATAYQDTIHLTRLATSPRFQRRGIAITLLQQMLQHYPAMAVTVNTQHTNTASQRLYEKLGFRLLSFNTPVWRRKINE